MLKERKEKFESAMKEYKSKTTVNKRRHQFYYTTKRTSE